MTEKAKADIVERLRGCNLPASDPAWRLTKEAADEIERLRAVMAKLAQESSPFDLTGEPLHVRIAKDLRRRIDLARNSQ